MALNGFEDKKTPPLPPKRSIFSLDDDRPEAMKQQDAKLYFFFFKKLFLFALYALIVVIASYFVRLEVKIVHKGEMREPLYMNFKDYTYRPHS